MCCSGKSYLAELISSIFDVELIHSDDFYLPKADRKTDWLESVAGNMNIKYLEEAIIQRKYRPFDCRSQSYGSSISLKDKPVIVEGTYSLLTNIHYDLKIFLSCDLNKQLNRLRNREEDIKSFEDIWLVKERTYFDSFDIINKTDMIINTDKYF